ncbi:MAG: 6-phosphogluconolactonase [Candidatus Melainabacteria bacterium]|nr:6-phosphogluconolactonase [Candidatus Melainabacteria bacterium]
MTASAGIHVFDTSKELIAKAAEDIVNAAARAVADHGHFTIALSGGSTPKPLYELLASAPLKYEMPWKKTFFFFGDERCVPHTSDESNFKMAKQTLFKPDLVRDENVFATELQDSDPEESAKLYEEEIQAFFDLEENQFPKFDLILLGLGDDGHTASLFPGTAALNECRKICVANYVEKFKTNRITLTLPVLDNAVNVWFIVSGKGKSKVVSEIISGKDKDLYPAQMVKPVSGQPQWYLDKDAASALDPAFCRT